MPLRDTPIQRKLVVIILLTTALALLLMRSAFFAYEYLTFRETTLRQSETLARVIAANSTAVLTFGDEHDAEETLSAFKAEGSLLAAALYDEGGNLFSYYPTNLPPTALPEKPEPDGFHFGGSYLTGFEPVVEKGERKGTLYLKFDTGTVMREWLRVSGLIGAGVISTVLLVTFLFSRKLQQQISQPILALAEMARAVSTRRDYSVRARKLGGDEVGLLTDAFNQMLTEIQEQNQALGESEARVRSVLDSALSAVVVIDASGRITDWNARAETIFGWTHAEALGLVLAETIIPVRMRESHRRGLQHYLNTGEGPVLNKPIEMSALRRDGTEFPVELSISPMKIGGVVSFCGFITDITERRRQEEMRARFVAIVESSDDAIFSKTLEGRITSWNPGAEKLFGYTTEEILGRPMAMLIPPERMEEEAQILTLVSRGENIAHFDTVRIRKDGNAVDVSVSISPIKDKQGKTSGVSTIARDITERRRAEERFRSVVESSPNAIVLINRAGTITMVNAQTEKMFGYSRIELVGQSIENLVPERFRGRHPDYRAGFFTSPSARSMGAGRELFGVRKDGREVPVEIGINPIETKEGVFVLASIIDISERKRAEQQVMLQATALETAANAIMITNHEGTILWTNPAFSALTGYASEEVLGRNPRVLKSGKHDQAFYKILWGTLLKGQTWRGNFTNRRKDGSLYQDEHTITPVRSADGAITHLIAIMQDVTERNRAQLVLRKSEAQMRLVWENSLDGMRLVDEEGVIRMVNNAYCRMMGKSREALEGRRISDLYQTPGAEEILRLHRERFKAHSIPAHHETEVTLWDGRRLTLELSNSFLVVEGQIPLLFSTFRDITERKQADKREGAFAKLGQSLSAVATATEAARLIAETADDLFGSDACTLDMYSSERDVIYPVINIDTIEGKRVDVPPAYTGEAPSAMMRRVIQQGAQLILRKAPYTFSPEIVPFGNTNRPSASLMYVPIRRGQEVIGILSIQSYTPEAYDQKALNTLQTLADQCAGAMERVRAEEDLRRLNDELEQRVRDRTAQLEAANKELESFSYSVSHDLRAPLRHIDGFSEMLRKESTSGLSAPGLRYLGIISHSAKRMGTLIDDLLVFSRMGRAALRPTQVKMDDLLAEVLREIAVDLKDRTIQWDIGPLAVVNGDRPLFKQVWVNLLANAVKYTRHRAVARIQIRCRKNDQGEFEFSVKDNGAGFDMAFAGKLFGVFQRLHQAEEFEGTGIGLANVRRIVSRHGGRSWGEGKVDAGATFYFTVPDSLRKEHEPTRTHSAG